MAGLVLVDRASCGLPWIVQPLRIYRSNIHVHSADQVLDQVLGMGQARGVFRQGRPAPHRGTVVRQTDVTLTAGHNATLQMWRPDCSPPRTPAHMSCARSPREEDGGF